MCCGNCTEMLGRENIGRPGLVGKLGILGHNLDGGGVVNLSIFAGRCVRKERDNVLVKAHPFPNALFCQPPVERTGHSEQDLSAVLLHTPWFWDLQACCQPGFHPRTFSLLQVVKRLIGCLPVGHAARKIVHFNNEISLRVLVNRASVAKLEIVINRFHRQSSLIQS